MKIYLENVRSFVKPLDLRIRPLTLLVGENSTGKSTFLAMLAYLSQNEFPGIRPNFNTPPFDLGTYDSIATYKGGRYGRSTHFSVGFQEETRLQRQYRATFTNHRGQPQLRTFLASGRMGSISLELGDDLHGQLTGKTLPGQKYEANVNLATAAETGFLVSLLNAASTVDRAQADDLQKLIALAIELLHRDSSPVIALAPIRTKPRRTYDEWNDEFTPEGDHIPVLLARSWQEERTAHETSRLFSALNDFGQESALFRKLGVRRLGTRPTDPFQLLVTTEGPPVNLTDVGYGVSQALPLVVQGVLASEKRRLLLQQPEVHLHPRGQAALGSFFARCVTQEGKALVVETHSDHLVDRIRLEIAQGNLDPNDAVIMFFEKNGMETRIHEIGIDTGGNVVNAPDSYRRFFFEEEVNLLSRVKS